jgi:hypothetical protein
MVGGRVFALDHALRDLHHQQRFALTNNSSGNQQNAKVAGHGGGWSDFQMEF